MVSEVGWHNPQNGGSNGSSSQGVPVPSNLDHAIHFPCDFRTEHPFWNATVRAWPPTRHAQAVSIAPRGSRAECMLKIQVGAFSKNPGWGRTTDLGEWRTCLKNGFGVWFFWRVGIRIRQQCNLVLPFSSKEPGKRHDFGNLLA